MNKIKKILLSLNESKDLTCGSPTKLILEFGLPLLFGLLFQQFYNMVDSIIVGQKLGTDALAAVGSTGCINFMILGFCMGVCNGFAIPVAQSFGAKDFKSLKKYITSCVWMSILFSAVLTTVICIMTYRILIWLKTPDGIIKDAYSYIHVIFLGIPIIFLYNMTSAILRSLGDSLTPVIFLVLSSIINIILDFILVVPMGVMGAAVATLIAQSISGIICLFYMMHKLKYLEFCKEDWHFSKRACLKLCGIGVPMGLQYSITAIGSVILQSAVNDMGETYVAAVAAGAKISMFVCCPFEAMGTSMATYGGQNVGAKRLDRVDAGLKACIKLGIIYAIISFVFILLFGNKLALLFVKKSETQLIHYIYTFIVGNSAFYVCLALVNIVRFMIQGLGYSAFAILAGICEMLARSIAGFVLVPFFGFTCVALANPLAWIAADIFLIPAYIWVMKQLRNKLNPVI